MIMAAVCYLGQAMDVYAVEYRPNTLRLIDVMRDQPLDGSFLSSPSEHSAYLNFLTHGVHVNISILLRTTSVLVKSNT